MHQEGAPPQDVRACHAPAAVPHQVDHIVVISADRIVEQGTFEEPLCRNDEQSRFLAEMETSASADDEAAKDGEKRKSEAKNKKGKQCKEDVVGQTIATETRSMGAVSSRRASTRRSTLSKIDGDRTTMRGDAQTK